jgi:hypothetical protein
LSAQGGGLSRFYRLLFMPLLLAGCAAGEVLPHYDDGGTGDHGQRDSDPVLDTWGDAPLSNEGGVDAADAAVDAAADAGLCHGPAGCDDGLACTDDICLEAGTCANPLKSGHCLIAGACYTHGDKQSAGGCNTCDSAASTSAWSGDASLCADDGLSCTSTSCKAGACGHELSAGHCLVGGACIADGAASPQNVCQVCDTKVSTSALQAKANGSACAPDSLNCTSDVCAVGACTHPQQSGTCLIGGTCFASGAAHPSADCLGCVPASSASTWSTLPDGSACSADGLTCTSDSCKAGTCTHATQAGSCLIGGTCHASGAKSAVNDCVACNPASPNVWTPLGDGTPCAADSFSCTSDSCQSGLCAHPVSSGSCLIGGACYTSGLTNPTGACSFCKPTASQSAWTPLSYQGCCAGATVVYCDSGTLKGLDCTANPSCGWDASFGYYDCGTSGSADPSGINPKSCL